MTSILGLAPILDFDGTLTTLPVPWDVLRRRLGIDRIGNLWQLVPNRWDIVAREEVRAAEVSAPRTGLLEELQNVRAFSILTANSEEAVHRFVQRFEGLSSRMATVIGRETMMGPKTAFEFFRAGFVACVEATKEAREGGRVVYVGHEEYELEFAQTLGAVALRVEAIAPEHAEWARETEPDTPR